MFGNISFILLSYIVRFYISFQVLFGSLFLFIVYFMSAQPIDLIRFSEFMAIGLFTGYTSEGLGFLIGSSMKNSVSKNCICIYIVKQFKEMKNSVSNEKYRF